ncbi:MAG TPA: hypothetical protein VMW04_04645 [Patescibacteria group bacterium]|nr:hypothetical protein [Patescibacteria group bacterium]
MPNITAQQEEGYRNLGKRLLKERGLSRLVKLLKKDKENEFLRTIKEYALRKNEDGRTPKPKLLKEYRARLTFIHSSRFPVISALNESGKVKLTPLGKIVKSLYDYLENNKIDGFLFLISGAAKETIGFKSELKSRVGNNKNFVFDDFNPKIGPPKIDGDFILILNNSNITEELIVSELKKEIEDIPLEIRTISSNSRPFKRIEIGTVFNKEVPQDEFWADYWQSYGHIVSPKFSGGHSFNFSLIQNLMNDDNSSPYVLMVPTKTSEEFIGVRIDFFPESRLYKAIIYPKNSLNTCSLKPTVINWPEIMFPFKNSAAEALAILIHLLRNTTWDDRLPLISSLPNTRLRSILTKKFQGRIQKIKSISADTSLYFARKIVYPTALNINLIAGNPISVRQSTERLLKSIKPMLNGNPYLGLIYLLSAGENPTDAPVYGTGFIDPKGFFPELYEFFHQEDRLDRLINLMAKTEEGPAMKGWLAFLNFIYRETGFDLKKTAKLLNPNFCSLKVYPNLVKDFISPDLESHPDSFQPISAISVAST